MANRTIVQITPTELKGAPSILFNPSNGVGLPSDVVNALVRDMVETMHAHPICVGLAAVQVGVNQRIVVLNISKDKTEADLVLTNPVIVSVSGKKDIKRESCMSLPNWMGNVERRDKIEITYYDLDGNKQELAAKGFLARAIQHEMDHLSGKLYAHRLVPGSKLQDASDLFRKDVTT
jgi:peptide deformylase